MIAALTAVLVIIGGLGGGGFGLSAAHGQAIELAEAEINGSIAAGGLGFVHAHRWGEAKARVINRTDDDRAFRVIWYFGNESNRQYVRHVWVPAASVRTITWPIHLDEFDKDQRVVEGVGILMACDEEVGFGDVRGSMVVRSDERLALMVNPGNDQAYDGVQAVRDTLGLQKGMVTPLLFDLYAPRDTPGWDAVEAAVLADPNLTLDPAQRETLRRWVHGGGTLWVMLDAVDPARAEQWLGDDWGIAFVDGVSHMHIQFTGEATSKKVDSDTPINMTRIIAPPNTTRLWIDGWPALVDKRVGAGRLIVTTVEPRAWLGDGAGNSFKDVQQVIATAAFPEDPITPAAATQRAIDPYVEAQVGYQVVGRAPVAMMLGAYVVAFVGIGVVLLIKGRGDRMAPVGIALAIITGLAVWGFGKSQRGDEKPTASILQVVHVEPGSALTNIRGSVGLFAPARRTVNLESRSGGRAWPRPEYGDHGIRQITWSDLYDWQWHRVSLTPRVMERADFNVTTELAQPMRLAVHLDAERPTGTLTWTAGELPEAMLLLTPTAACPVTVVGTEDGQTQLSFGDALPPDTYTDTGVLNQTQRQRADVIAELRNTAGWPDRPLLVGWTGLIDDGITIPDGFDRRGMTLWCLPVNPMTATPGQRVAVPRAWVAMQPQRRRIPGVPNPVSNWNPFDREFIDTPNGGAVVLRFDPPHAVKPMAIDRATLHLNIAARQRVVEVLIANGNKTAAVATLNSPDGEQVVEIDSAAIEKIGGATDHMTVVLNVGNPTGSQPGQRTSLTWRIRRAGLAVGGVVGKR